MVPVVVSKATAYGLVASLLQRQLEEKEDRRMAAEESFSSLAQEVEVKTRKLQKLWDKLKV
jgi:kinesin family protein 3/17